MQLFHCSLECFSDPLDSVCVWGGGMPCNGSVSPLSSPICLPLSHAELLSVLGPFQFQAKLNSLQFSGHYFHDVWPASHSLSLSFVLNPSSSLMSFFCGISRKVSCPAGGIQIGLLTQTAHHLSFKLYLYMQKMQLASFCQSFISSAFILILVFSPIMNLQNISVKIYLFRIYNSINQWRVLDFLLMMMIISYFVQICDWYST